MFNKVNEILRKILGWIATDGLLHILVTWIIMMVLGWVRPAWVIGVIAITVGVSKEVFDIFSAKRFDKEMLLHCLHDLACDCIGIVLGYLGLLINTL